MEGCLTLSRFNNFNTMQKPSTAARTEKTGTIFDSRHPSCLKHEYSAKAENERKNKSLRMHSPRVQGIIIRLHEKIVEKKISQLTKIAGSRIRKIQVGAFTDNIYWKHPDIYLFEAYEQRKNTFLSGWEINVLKANRLPKNLAEAGFFCRHNSLEVQCCICKLITSVDTWGENETPYQAHARLSPKCSFLKFIEDKIHASADAKTKETKGEKLSLANKDTSSKTHQSNAPPVPLPIQNATQGRPKFELSINTFTKADVEQECRSSLKKGHENNGKQYIDVDHAEANDGYLVTGFNKVSLLQRPDVPDRKDYTASVFHSETTKTSVDAMNSLLTNSVLNLPVHEPEFRYPQFRSLTSRLRSYENWKFANKQTPQILAEAGYFFTEHNDIVRCFCCDLGLAEWDPKDNPWIEHARHNPKCWFLMKEKGDLFIENIQKDWRKIYNPKHAAFDDKKSRIATFDGWRQDIEQTPDILADAGFFYTGEEDVVRCHYCDGGLRNWEPGDAPWEEHARWFPFCKFVIKMKGREYIEEIKRQIEARQITEAFKNEANVTQSLQDNPAVAALKEMEFSASDIHYAIQEYTRLQGNSKYSSQDLIELIINKTDRTSPSAESPFGVGHNNPLTEPECVTDPQKLREINRQLKERMKCIRCRTNEICMLFVNCGHRMTCEECAYKMDFCPHCDTKIKKRLKTFLS